MSENGNHIIYACSRRLTLLVPSHTGTFLTFKRPKIFDRPPFFHPNIKKNFKQRNIAKIAPFLTTFGSQRCDLFLKTKQKRTNETNEKFSKNSSNEKFEKFWKIFLEGTGSGKCTSMLSISAQASPRPCANFLVFFEVF